MDLEIDYKSCAGHGVCFMQAQELFDCDDEGRGVVIEPTVPDALLETAREAAGGCPEQAVLLLERSS